MLNKLFHALVHFIVLNFIVPNDAGAFEYLDLDTRALDSSESSCVDSRNPDSSPTHFEREIRDAPLSNFKPPLNQKIQIVINKNKIKKEACGFASRMQIKIEQNFLSPITLDAVKTAFKDTQLLNRTQATIEKNEPGTSTFPRSAIVPSAQENRYSIDTTTKFEVSGGGFSGWIKRRALSVAKALNLLKSPVITRANCLEISTAESWSKNCVIDPSFGDGKKIAYESNSYTECKTTPTGVQCIHTIAASPKSVDILKCITSSQLSLMASVRAVRVHLALGNTIQSGSKDIEPIYQSLKRYPFSVKLSKFLNDNYESCSKDSKENDTIRFDGSI